MARARDGVGGGGGGGSGFGRGEGGGGDGDAGGEGGFEVGEEGGGDGGGRGVEDGEDVEGFFLKELGGRWRGAGGVAYEAEHFVCLKAIKSWGGGGEGGWGGEVAIELRCASLRELPRRVHSLHKPVRTSMNKPKRF